MKNFRFILFVLLISIGSTSTTFANENNPTGLALLKSEIAHIMGKHSLKIDRDLKVDVEFRLNTNKEIQIISINSEDPTV